MSTDVAPVHAGPWWITRDTDERGIDLDLVDVWTERPTLLRRGLMTCWRAPDGAVVGHWHRYKVGDADLVRWCRTQPETHRECVRVG